MPRQSQSKPAGPSRAPETPAFLHDLPLERVPALMRDPDGPDLVPSPRALEDEFFAEFPEMRERVLVVDRLRTNHLIGAAELAAQRPADKAPNPEKLDLVISYMDVAKMEEIDANLGDGSPFCHSLSLDGEPVFHFVQPLMLDGGLHNPAAMGLGAMPWHNQIQPPDRQRLAIAAAGAGWHEFGHALFNDQGFAQIIAEKVASIEAHEDLALLMTENAEEIFCDGFALGKTMQRGPKLAVPMLRDMVHGRILNTVAGMALDGWGPKHMPDPAWRDLARDLSRPENHANAVEIIDMTMSHAIDRMPNPAAMLEVIHGLSGLYRDVHKSRRFFRAMGELGAKAQFPETYVMARDYLDVLDQRLPPQSGYREAIHRARNQVGLNRAATEWDQMYPDIESSLTALAVQLRRQPPLIAPAVGSPANDTGHDQAPKVTAVVTRRPTGP